MRRFVGVDGESYTDPRTGDHRYVLLANSLGHYIYEPRGLSTVRCIEFLLDLPQYMTPVAFGWNYDVNMMLGDLDPRTLIRLYKERRARWLNYTFEWIPNKWLYIRSSKKRHVRISDIFGFFQTSFVNALKMWEIRPQESMEEMKAVRSAFDPSMKADLISYCLGECRQMVELIDSVELALHDVALKPRSWVGAGSLASALLSREAVKMFHEYDHTFPEPVQDALRRAYFGGRSELFQQGTFDALHDYDISSAYPSEARDLPPITNGRWHGTTRYDPDEPYAVWKVRWDWDRDSLICPFPFRKGTDIFYPSRGSGWYHASEVRAANALDGVEVLAGYVFEPRSPGQPFSFVDEIYEYRSQLKHSGHQGEKVLKLALNAIYGKLAQGYGYRGKLPPFQSYFWAGMITAGTRARILKMAALAPDDLVMVATDGIFFRQSVPLEPRGGLGGIDLTLMNDVFVAQPGVYHARVDDSYIGRSRGFFVRELRFDDLRAGYAAEGPTYIGQYESTRFSGLGSCLVRRDLTDWRRWVTAKRSLSLYPSRKFLSDNPRVTNPVRHFPPRFDARAMSDPYLPKDSNVSMSDADVDALLGFLQGTEQPLREFD